MLSLPQYRRELQELERERKRVDEEYSAKLVALARTRARLVGRIRDAEWNELPDKERMALVVKSEVKGSEAQ